MRAQWARRRKNPDSIATVVENKETAEPAKQSDDGDNPISPGEFSGLVRDWFQHYWDVPREKSKRTDIATVVLTAMIAVFAGWSAWIFYEQLDEMQRSTRFAQRAWMIGAGATFTQLEVGKMVKVRFDSKNNGQTPAVNAIIEGSENHWTSGQPKPPKDEFGDKPPTGNGIIVRSGGGTAITWNVLLLTATTLQQLHEGKLNIRVYGKTFYDDVFGHQHWTTFCAVYDEESSGFVGCDEGHQMDNDPE